jgi:hypothetical protein
MAKNAVLLDQRRWWGSLTGHIYKPLGVSKSRRYEFRHENETTAGGFKAAGCFRFAD